MKNIYRDIARSFDFALRAQKPKTYGQILYKDTKEDRSIVSVADTLDCGWETAICIASDTHGEHWFIKEGKFDKEISKAKTLGQALRILFSIEAPWSRYSMAQNYFDFSYEGFNTIENITLDHSLLKNRIKEWEIKTDSIATRIDNKELQEELLAISDEMMAVNI